MKYYDIQDDTLYSIDCRVKRWWKDNNTKQEIIFMLETASESNGEKDIYYLFDVKYSGVKLFLGASSRCKNIFHLHGSKKEEINTISLKFPSNGLNLTTLVTSKKNTWHGPHIMNHVKVDMNSLPTIKKLFQTIAKVFNTKINKFHLFVNKTEGRIDFVAHLNSKFYKRIEITFEPHQNDSFWF